MKRIKQYISTDQLSEYTQGWIESVIDEYDLKSLPFVEVKDRQICSPYVPPISSGVDKSFVSDDLITEIIVNDRLFALMYKRRDNFNYTEITQFIFGTKALIKKYKKRNKEL